MIFLNLCVGAAACVGMEIDTVGGHYFDSVQEFGTVYFTVDDVRTECSGAYYLLVPSGNAIIDADTCEIVIFESGFEP